MMSLASFLSATPHFLSEPYEPISIPSFLKVNTGNKTTSKILPQLCTEQDNVHNITEISALSNFGKKENSDSWLYILIAVGSIIKGMGHTPLHPLGVAFIDDFASPENSAMYIS